MVSNLTSCVHLARFGMSVIAMGCIPRFSKSEQVSLQRDLVSPFYVHELVNS